MSPYSIFSLLVSVTINFVLLISGFCLHSIISILNSFPYSFSCIWLFTIAFTSMVLTFLYIFSNLFSFFTVIMFEIKIDIMNIINILYGISFIIYLLVFFKFIIIIYRLIMHKNRTILFSKYSPANIPIIYPIVIISILFI